MAKLQSDELILDVKFKSCEYEWIGYEIMFYWKDDIIINDNILKRDGEWWGKRNYGTFLANDYQRDHLITTIKEILQTNKADYWEPLEPDIKLAIYPEEFFPFLKSHWTLIDEEEQKEDEGQDKEHAEQDKEHAEQDKGQDKERRNDLFTMIVFIDSYNFKDRSAYSGEGISLHIVVRREDLEKFVSDLEIEYKNLSNLQS